MEKSYEVLRLNMKLSEVQLLLLRAIFHTLPLFYIFANVNFTQVPQASQAHVTSVLCKFSHKRVGVALHLATVETLYEKQNTEVYVINKGDLPVMYSILGKSPLFILYRKNKNKMIFSVHRPQYSISHTKSQRSLRVTRHRLSCEKIHITHS